MRSKSSPFFLIIEKEILVSFLEGKTPLPKEHRHHLRNVLRIRKETSLQIGDGEGKVWEIFLSKEDFCKEILSYKEYPLPSPIFSLYMPFFHKKRLEKMIEKLTELGIHRIYWIFSQHAQISRMDLSRLQRIAQSACEQSRNPYLPTIKILKESLEEISFHPEGFYFWGKKEGERFFPKFWEKIQKEDPIEIGFINGPEGGWSKEEEEFLKNNFPCISFSKNVLRAETAAIVALSYMNLCR